MPGGLGFGGGIYLISCVGMLTIGADSTLNLSNLTTATNCTLTSALTNNVTGAGALYLLDCTPPLVP